MTAAKPLFIQPAAHADIEAATDHYFEAGGEGLATRWAGALETALRHVQSRPATGSARYAATLGRDGLRFWRVARFPYLVFFIETAGSVSVLRVLHGSRDLPATLREEDGHAATES